MYVIHVNNHYITNYPIWQSLSLNFKVNGSSPDDGAGQSYKIHDLYATGLPEVINRISFVVSISEQQLTNYTCMLHTCSMTTEYLVIIITEWQSPSQSQSRGRFERGFWG